MNDLIKEIEGLKRPNTKVSFDEGFNKGIDKCIETLNQHNIITAPKSIKLSEIVSKLNEIYNDSEFSRKIYFNRKLNAIGEGEYDKDWFMNTWTPYILFKENKISKIVKTGSERNKWLYTLWLTGTEIIDDMEE